MMKRENKFREVYVKGMERENKFREFHLKGMQRENKFREFRYFSSLQPRKYLAAKISSLKVYHIQTTMTTAFSTIESNMHYSLQHITLSFMQSICCKICQS